ncbi:MAG TPA: metallopeptidase TldD-related protein [Thermoanaerobaculaceae bacterium]|nr:metallopeptidase TldD-related protein [Thermoanaerobaculaceae bacterium]
MKSDWAALPPAMESAAVVLAASGGRWEVMGRRGRTLGQRWWAGGWESRVAEESGVACRVASHGGAGFAAAAGQGARAGRLAADIAMASLVSGPDPLPPGSRLGHAVCPPAPVPIQPTTLRAAAEAQLAALGRYREVEVLELRLSSSTAITQLVTTDGHPVEGHLGGTVLELLLAAAEGPARLIQVAARELGQIDVTTVAERAAERVALASRGGRAEHQLADVTVAPSVAAPLVLALADRLQRAHRDPHDRLRTVRVAPDWRLTDERAGPEGLLPQAFDGEGLPSRSHALLADGHLGDPLLSWAEAMASGGTAGGAVRPSFRQAPRGGPANLVVHPSRPLSARALLDRLETGFWLDLPAGGVRIDPAGERFALRAAAVAMVSGRPVASHPQIELRGTFRRLLAGLAGTGLDSQSFSLACAVTTPSLLFRRLEVVS